MTYKEDFLNDKLKNLILEETDQNQSTLSIKFDYYKQISKVCEDNSPKKISSLYKKLYDAKTMDDLIITTYQCNQ